MRPVLLLLVLPGLTACLEAPERPEAVPPATPLLGTYTPDELDGLLDLGPEVEPWIGILGHADLTADPGPELFASTTQIDLVAVDPEFRGAQILDEPLLQAAFDAQGLTMGPLGPPDDLHLLTAGHSTLRIDPVPLADGIDLSSPYEPPWISGDSARGVAPVPNESLLWVGFDRWDDNESDRGVALYDLEATDYTELGDPIAEIRLEDDWSTPRLWKVTEESLTGDGDGELLMSERYDHHLFVHADPRSGLAATEQPAARIDTDAASVNATFVGDLNGDGDADLALMLATGWDGGLAAALFFGPLAGDYALDDADVQLQGSDLTAGGYGRVAGDLNGDGVLDLAFGDPFFESNRGVVRVFYGPFEPGEYVLSGPDVQVMGETPGCYEGVQGGGDQVGRLMMFADGNQDGIDDLYVAANPVQNRDADCEAQTHHAAIVVAYGRR